MTVYCVDGFLFKGFVDDLDLVKALPGEKKQVEYDNSLATEANIAKTANQIRIMLKDGDVCVGVSMGAQVLARLLRDYGPDKRVDASFILLANPEHKYTGRVKTPQYGGVGLPVETPYATIDLACQYDYWADAPTSPGWAAQLNSWLIGNKIHTMNYFHVGLDNPYIQEGNIKYMWAPSSPIWFLSKSMVEKSYSRPITL